MARLSYLRRIISAYLIKEDSHLSFWHGSPEINENLSATELGEYYMVFAYKAQYPGPFDEHEIPMLDYKGNVGRQYNPIAIAQYGLGHYNRYERTGQAENRNVFLKVADWLVSHLEPNPGGIPVWNHYFDWEYRDTLKSPWYSALSQGQGISLLLRAFKETGDAAYIDAARQAFTSFNTDISAGGVNFKDKQGYLWFEEAIVNPPTHILNGFMWALWGIYDYYLISREDSVKGLFDQGVNTLKDNLNRFDTGFWSLYEISGTRLKMLASAFYHSLHIVQLQVMFRLTKDPAFKEYAERWSAYQGKSLNRMRAWLYKAVFKVFYY